MTHLCVSIYVHNAEQARRDLAKAAERGADLVELRLDTFTDESAVRQLLKAAGVATIVTVRSSDEGGQTALDDVSRLSLLTVAGENGASYLDIEWATVADNSWAGPQQPRTQRAGWIYSAHNFLTRPPDLNTLMLDLLESPADIVKVAWRARSVRDNLEAFDLILQRRKPTIAICMGEAGLLSRVLAKKFGAFLTFASLDGESATAPGQVAIDDLKRLYRWDAQNAQTKVFGVVGHPIAHSMSPAIHNAAFDEVGFDGVYVPFLVEPNYESFKAFMEEFLNFPQLHLCGLSVTLPHKENARRYLIENGGQIEPLAEAIGAVNTITINREGESVRLAGRNTDYAAILDSITSALGVSRDDLRGRRVGLIGAGGTGRTAVAALAAVGAEVTIFNRTIDRARALADEFGSRSAKVTAADMEKLADSANTILINTTSVGMFPKVDASPLDGYEGAFESAELVFDCVYNPPTTRLLRSAEAAGVQTVSGVEMFVRQAAAQFEAYTSAPAPVAVMRQVVETLLRR